MDSTKAEPQLILTKMVDGKAQELVGVDKERATSEHVKKWNERKTSHHKIIT